MMKKVHRIFTINIEGLDTSSADNHITKFKEQIGETPINYLDYFIPVKYGDNSLVIIETES